MIILVIGLFLTVAALMTALCIAFQNLKAGRISQATALAEAQGIADKYKDVMDLEAFKADLSRQLSSIQSEIDEARQLSQSLNQQTAQIKHQLELFSGEQTVVDCGLYTPVYDFDISTKYKDALDHVRALQKSALKEGRAATCSQAWSLNGSASEGKRHVGRLLQLMLRAFNGEADALVAHVRWDNINRMIDRINATYAAINKLDDTHTLKIEQSYLDLKVQELRLMHEFKEKQQAEKEQARKIQQQAREEQKAQQAFDADIGQAEEKEKQLQTSLEEAKGKMQSSQDAATIAAQQKMIADLQASLAQVVAEKAEKIKMKHSRAGFVYLISNIGSFGPNRFKIGMTRREVEVRVDELGDASVPFDFDVHAKIRTDDAFTLESQLHERLKNRRMNVIQDQKEFFEIDIDEMTEVLRAFDPNVEVVKDPVAKEYYQTLAQRNATRPASRSAAVAPALNGSGISLDANQVAPESQIYVFNNGSQEGPFTFEAINQKLANGQLNPATAMLWYQGIPEWRPLSSFRSK